MDNEDFFMSSYVGRHAELYDLFYSEKDYQKEAKIVHTYIQRYGSEYDKEILELACGTGSHAFALEKFGYKIIATDYSDDMLNCAKKKAFLSSSTIEFRKQDMRNLDLAEGPFDVIICLFDSIGYVITNKALEQVFQGVQGHLRKRGLFIFEFWHAAAMLKNYDPLRIKKWKTPSTEITRISETSLDVIHQVSNVKYSILELQENGNFKKIEEEQKNRFFLIQEMSFFLSQNNFSPEKFFAGFSFSENITEDTWHILCIARKG
jgi:SAM-dependent methyltransferase